MVVHEFELGHNATEATKNICCAKEKDADNPSTVTKRLEKFRKGFKNLDD